MNNCLPVTFATGNIKGIHRVTILLALSLEIQFLCCCCKGADRVEESEESSIRMRCTPIEGMLIYYKPLEILAFSEHEGISTCESRFSDIVGITTDVENMGEAERGLHKIGSELCRLVREIDSKRVLVCRNQSASELIGMVELAIKDASDKTHAGLNDRLLARRTLILYYIYAMLMYHSGEFLKSRMAVDNASESCRVVGACVSDTVPEEFLRIAGAQAAYSLGEDDLVLKYSDPEIGRQDGEPYAVLGHLRAMSLLRLGRKQDACETLRTRKSRCGITMVYFPMTDVAPCLYLAEKGRELKCNEGT